MRRRLILSAAGAAALTPRTASAQARPLPMVAYLGSETPELFASRLRAFHEGLASGGFVEGRDVSVEYRWARGRNDALPALAAEMARLDPRVIAAPGSVASALAAKAATTTIPVVFEIGADPVAAGLVPNLTRPGGNVTGVTSLNAEVGPRRLALLLQVVPRVSTAAVLVNPTNPRNAEASAAGAGEAARRLGIKLLVVEAATEPELEAAVAGLAGRGAGALLVANDTYYWGRAPLLAALTLRHRVPAAHQSREFTRAGGLMSYGGDVSASHRQAGHYVGRVLKGEKPGDLPVHRATRFELAVNLKTARSLGLTVPTDVLAGADEVVE